MTTRRPSPAMAVLLLLLAALNAVDFCKAAVPRHPCCPASRQHSPERCAKLGCFMSEPALRVTPRAIRAWPVARPDSPQASHEFAAYAAVHPVWLAPVFDRSILFRRLLI